MFHLKTMNKFISLLVLIGLTAYGLEVSAEEPSVALDDLVPPMQAEGAEDPPRILGTKDPDNGQEFLSKLYCGSYFHRSYDKINAYLVDNVRGADPASNMAKAVEWLHEEERHPNPLNHCLIKALRQFIDLSMANKENLCTYEQFKVIYFNDKALGDKIHHPPGKLKPELFTRIQRIIYGYALDHAIECHLRYPEFFAQLRPRLNKDIMDPLETYLKTVVDFLTINSKTGFFGMKKVDLTLDPVKTLRNMKSLKEAAKSQITYTFLSDRSISDPDRIYLAKTTDEKTGKRVVMKDKIGELLDRYISEPCKYYMETTGPSVFIPAAYDLTMLDRDDRYSTLDETTHNFLHGWIRYRICDLILREDRSNLIEGVSKIAKKTE